MEIKKFIYGIIIVFIIFLFISLPSIFFQFKAGEYSNAQSSASIQINSDECVVQQVSAGIQKWELGYEVIKQIRPKVVITGPGTANNYSGDFFSMTNYVLGQYISNSKNSIYEINRVFEIFSPEMVILTIDPWWLSNLDNTGTQNKFSLLRRWTSLIYKLYLPYVWIYRGDLNFTEFLTILKRKDKCPIGLRALAKDKHGTKKDGSWHYGNTSINFKYSKDDLKNSIELNTSPKVNKENIKSLIKFIDLVEKYGSKAIIIVPPFAPSIYKEMKKKRKSFYIEKSKKLFNFKLNKSIFFFTDPSELNTSDSEFLNPYSYGKTVSARMLAKLSEIDNEINQYLNINKINQFIKLNQGKKIPD